MANIAEGFVRHSDREFVQSLFVAMASAAEIQSHLYVAVDQGYLLQGTFDSIYICTSRENQQNHFGPHQVSEKKDQTDQIDGIDEIDQMRQTNQIDGTD